MKLLMFSKRACIKIYYIYMAYDDDLNGQRSNTEKFASFESEPLKYKSKIKVVVWMEGRESGSCRTVCLMSRVMTLVVSGLKTHSLFFLVPRYCC